MILGYLLNTPIINDFIQKLLEGDYSQELKNMVPLDEKGVCVDIGCGTGGFSDLWHDLYIGVDLNERFVKNARKKHISSQSKNFLCCDMFDFLDNYEATINFCLIINVIHHLNDEELEDLLAIVSKKVLGHVLLSDMIPRPDNAIARFLYSVDQGRFIRSYEAQRNLISKYFVIQEEKSFLSPRRIYFHSAFLCRRKGN